MAELINITAFNPLISKCQIKVCWVGDEPNRNRSVITKETALGLANSLGGSPIVGKYNEATGDFEQHNKIIEIKDGKFRLEPDTKPYGFIDVNAKAWFQSFVDKDGVEREYLMTEGWLWTGQFPECQRVIQKGNNQSMELDENFIDAHWAKDENGNKEIFIINEAIISKLCILGEDYEPCFEGAEITAPKIEFSLDEDFQQQVFSMMTEIKNMLEGGTNVADEIKDAVVVEEAPVVEEPVAAADETPTAEFAEEQPEVEVCPECGKPLAECTCEEDKNVKYDLNEIPEYVELLNKCADLEHKLADAETQYSALASERDELAGFKANVEKKEKEAMIDSFYMLSDEQKADVRENIDVYSLEDIKSKLCVICVDNKVNFTEDTGSTEPVTYSLNSFDASNDDDIPDWIKAVKAINK